MCRTLIDVAGLRVEDGFAFTIITSTPPFIALLMASDQLLSSAFEQTRPFHRLIEDFNVNHKEYRE